MSTIHILPANEQEMSIEILALGGYGKASDGHAFTEADDNACVGFGVQVVDHL
jgi:hypothetical protein